MTKVNWNKTTKFFLKKKKYMIVYSVNKDEAIRFANKNYENYSFYRTIYRTTQKRKGKYEFIRK